MFDGVKEFLELVTGLEGNLEGMEPSRGRGKESLGKHGGLAVVDGKLVLKKPEGNGRWPTIIPGVDKRVKIFYRGKELRTPTVVENVHGFEFRLQHKPAQSSFQLEITRDKMELWLITDFIPGEEYIVRESNYSNQLVVTARKLKQIEPEVINPADVMDQINQLGIKTQLRLEQIVAACQERLSGRRLVAAGIPPKLPVDGQIKVVCDLRLKREPVEQGGKMNLLDRSRINSVQPGEVLAYWHPPVSGEPGQDIYGNKLEPRAPKWNRLTVGSGVKLIGDGTIAVAETAGRPCFERGRLCVKPQLIISSDVDVSTGNIEFTGDVLIIGDVKESLTVLAGGMVEVRGSVYHAKVFAGDDVIINKNLIGGNVRAGGELVNYQKLVLLIKQIIPQLEDLKTAFVQLQNHPKFSVADLKVQGDGYLIKLILEMRFGEIPQLFNDVLGLIPDSDSYCEDEPNGKLWELLRYIANRFMGANPLQIKAVSEIDNNIETLNKIAHFFDEEVRIGANITVYYCQNSVLQATGDIIVTGPLIYGCKMTAGDKIQLAGSCRGGSYFARSAIVAQSAGLNERVKTHLRVEKDGVIAAGRLNPGVSLRIGQAQMGIDKPRQDVRLKFIQGRWVEARRGESNVGS